MRHVAIAMLLVLALPTPATRAQTASSEPTTLPGSVPEIGARVRVVVPKLGPGWRTGMFNRTRQEPPCYVVVFFDPGSMRRYVATVYIGAVSRLQVSTLYPGGLRPADPDPGAAAFDGEEWRDVALDAANATGRQCPETIETAR